VHGRYAGSDGISVRKVRVLFKQLYPDMDSGWLIFLVFGQDDPYVVSGIRVIQIMRECNAVFGQRPVRHVYIQ